MPVASPRHADVLAVTGPVTHNMAVALVKTYNATPSPKYVIAIGDDACGLGIFNDSYAVVGAVEKVIPSTLKYPETHRPRSTLSRASSPS